MMSNNYCNLILKRFVVLMIVGFIVCNATLSKLWANSRCWDENEVSTLDVLKDLGQEIGTVFYVDGKNGNDNNNGLTEGTAWKTIGKALENGSPGPGDTIRIRAGVYRERIWIQGGQGTAEHRARIGPYGDGEVIIDCSDPLTSEWSQYSGNIYRASYPYPVTAVVVDEEPYFPEFSVETVNKGKYYIDTTNHYLYLYVKSGGSPATHTVGVIRDEQYINGITIQNKHYITLYGLTIKFAPSLGISILGNYVTVEKCNVKFNGKTGIGLYGYETTSSTGCVIAENHVYHNFMRNWPRGRYKWGSWGMGLVSNGCPNTTFIGNIAHKNGGEGLGAFGGANGIVFRDNISYDNWSVNIYFDNAYNGTIDRNLVYSHEPNLRDLYNNQDPNPSDGRCARRLRPEGIMTADEDYGIGANFRNTTITNNIIIGCRRGITHYAKAAGSGLKNVTIAFNTIIVPNAQGLGEKIGGIYVPYNSGNNSNTIFRNNIVYASHSDTYLLGSDSTSFNGLTFSHNIWYHAKKATPFLWGGSYNFNTWRYLGGGDQGVGSFTFDPLLTDVTGYTADAVRPFIGSPAIKSGIPILTITQDYAGNNRLNPPTIGAYEYENSVNNHSNSVGRKVGLKR
jgi:hypothetical protein